MFLIIIAIILLAIVGWVVLNDYYFYPQNLKKIQDMMGQQMYDEALKVINKLSEAKRVQPDIQHMIYEIYLMQKQYFMALFHLNEILKRGTYTDQITEISTRTNIAELYELMDKPKKALNEYYSIAEIDPDNYNANFKIGERLYFMRNLGAAQPYLEKAYNLDTANHKAAHYLAEVRFINEEYREALAMVDAIINGGGTEDELYLLRGKCHLKMGHYDECISDMAHIQNDPNFSDISRLISGIAYYNKGNEDKAEGGFKTALNRFNEDYQDIVLEARYIYSDILYKAGKTKDALNQLFFIRNSGKSYRDTHSKISLLSKLSKNKVLASAIKQDIDALISGEIEKGVSMQGHSVVRKHIIDARTGFVVFRKTISSGQSFKSTLGLDFNQKPTPQSLVENYLEFIKSENLNSGLFFSLFGADNEALSVVKNSPLEIDFLDESEFDSLVKGEKAL